jgi:hypothetical protein
MTHPRTVLTALFLLTAMAVSLAFPASAQTGAAGGPGAAAPGKLTLEKRVEEPEESPPPVPYNILDGADSDLVLALMGWSSKYRISPGIQDGDWVKYESVGDGPKQTLEIRAEKTEDGHLWLIETTKVAGQSGTTELHELLAPGKPKLLQAYRVAADGSREDLTPLDDETSGQLFMYARNEASEALGGNPMDYKVYDSGDVQRLEGPFGSLLCRPIEVRVAEDVDPISFATRRLWLPEGTLLWLNEDVPRLLPMADMLLPALLSPDDFMSVQGGLVRSPYHVLVEYGSKG